MLKQRIITALILAPLALAAVFYLPLGLFPIFAAIVAVIGAWEWGAFIPAHDQQPAEPSMTKIHRIIFSITMLMLIGSFSVLVPIDKIWLHGQMHPIYEAALIIAAAWWLFSTVMVFLYPKGQGFWQQSAFYKGLFGQLTLIPFWIGLVTLRSYGYNNDPMLGGFLILAIFGIVWGADIGAYFVGRQFGQRKLMPNVSPGKTLEGMMGGLVAALLTVAASHSFFYNIELLPLMLLGLITALASVFGDLSESMYKRSSGIKDSGTILPGHGGVLDRIDSLTAAVPLFALGYFFLVA
ncbi:phosphatidate cytidylyltransferase [Psychrobium sp. 1_MG-2023]|uniref:phosphatidate cytidylyltransferase n=1 Tax=Psychrobium sp. 1_MG-2023 TaxID=3062624 RepID=UPI000C33A93A|nr:phosphatidate cytidylyltransferase [Psychrobium sp. 1_MG-2023]MDP2559991.1 phosphatidate cytidylyltransferase [Psychrobium sp. 1_MG-2023]PKF56347.1 hypothetical protein CW748_10330 [Alteromonadales bacterium alter-6D02]